MSLRDNPLTDKKVKSQNPEFDKVMRQTFKEMLAEKLGLDHVPGDKVERNPNILVTAGMFIFNSLCASVRMIGELIFGLGILVLLFLIFVAAPIVAFQAFVQGQYVIGVACTLITLIAWGAAINEETRR